MKVVYDEADGWRTMRIDLAGAGYAVSGADVLAISMAVAVDPDDGCGDLAVEWDTGGLENTGGGDMDMLLMRGNDDEVGAVMSEFYWNDGFTDTLKKILTEAGYSAASVDGICTSEWGMQDEGRASYDAYELADEIRGTAAI